MISKFKLDYTKNAATKDSISRTLEIANNYAGELSIDVLPLNKLELDPENNRELTLTLEDALNGLSKEDPEYEKKKQDWKSLESLAKTIKEEQLINPIYVYRYGNKCRLIAGERRTLASAIAGRKEIIARIAAQRPVGTRLKVLQWIENNERSDLSLAERIASIEAILFEYKKANPKNQDRITAKLLSNLTGMSITQARRYILILQSSSEIKNAIQAGKIENIKLIELICSEENLEHQNQLLHAISSGASFGEIVKLKKDLNVSLTKIKKGTRGRKSNNVKIGAVVPKVAKLFINALLQSDLLESRITYQLQQVYNKLETDDIKSAEEGFKKVILMLENEAIKA